MRFVPKQCDKCPFRPTSAPGWLGEYTAGDVFRAIWHGAPFFCHPTINYRDPRWEQKAMAKGKLCTGGLHFANLILAPLRSPHPQIIRARELVKGIAAKLQVMRAQEFGRHHDPRAYESLDDQRAAGSKR